jgi:hypothetical protein
MRHLVISEAIDRSQSEFNLDFPFWLWYFCASDQSSRFDLGGFRMRNPVRMGDALWVRKNPSLSSSRSTGF